MLALPQAERERYRDLHGVGLMDWTVEELLIREEQDYRTFLESKSTAGPSRGKQVSADAIHSRLFAFQRDLTSWAIRKGQCAIFADTGLGKTLMQLEWARLITDERVLIVAPLSVARQTVREAATISLDLAYARKFGENDARITITNYEMLDNFPAARYTAVVLDESSILKSFDGKTRKKLIETFAQTPYRLCCTATPAPNDIAEIGNHSEFLGILRQREMLSQFFINRTQDEVGGWSLKGHARTAFFEWLASWGISLKRPSDLGYDDDGYRLPPLEIETVLVPSVWTPPGRLFAIDLAGIRERLSARRASIDSRVVAISKLVDNSDQWIIWCGFDKEAMACCESIPDAVEVRGSQSPEEKAEILEAFQDGKVRVLVTKPRIAGFGMNFQNCHSMIFAGLSDSWESYYQCIRRCYRFGQQHRVRVCIVVSEPELPIVENVARKERQAVAMSEELIQHVRGAEALELAGKRPDYSPSGKTANGRGWIIHNADSGEALAKIAPDSVGLSVFSPPFMSLYTYTPSERDIGNCRTEAEFWNHLRFVTDGLLRVTIPGRNCCVHVSQVPAMLVHDGYIGLRDFRGKTIQHFADRGWIYHGDICIDKDPQVQAVRTKAKGLLFAQLHKDASWLRPGLADYILVFRKPGENPHPIQPDVSNEDWICWARPVWHGIKETEVLNAGEGRDDKDEKHICPLQLEVIERCIRLWSNPDDLILDPFMGIGSTGYQAVRLGRDFVGIDLKPSYFAAAAKNLRRAEELSTSLFDYEVTA